MIKVHTRYEVGGEAIPRLINPRFIGQITEIQRGSLGSARIEVVYPNTLREFDVLETMDQLQEMIQDWEFGPTYELNDDDDDADNFWR